MGLGLDRRLGRRRWNRESKSVVGGGDVVGCGRRLKGRVQMTSAQVAGGEEGDGEEVVSMINAGEMNSPLWEKYVKMSNLFVNLFPVWTVLAAAAALINPGLFSWFTTAYFTASLAILMLSMGITLSIADFLRVFRRMGAVAVGFAGCYILMPILAFALAKGFDLTPALVAGTVLVGCVNGGQASNLCTYIANGNVALSVLMTTVSQTVGRQSRLSTDRTSQCG